MAVLWDALTGRCSVWCGPQGEARHIRIRAGRWTVASVRQWRKGGILGWVVVAGQRRGARAISM